MAMRDVAKLAIECVEAVRRHAPSEVAKSFRTRARQFHSDLYYQGVAYVIAVAAARSEKPSVLDLKNQDCEKLVSNVLKEVSGDEKMAYALYGGALLIALRRFGVVSSNDLTSVLKDLLDPGRAALASQVAGVFAEWVKRMAEAFFGE